MATKCKVIDINPSLHTIVFDFKGKQAFISHDTIHLYDGYIYVEYDEATGFKSVPMPEKSSKSSKTAQKTVAKKDATVKGVVDETATDKSSAE